MDIILEDQMLNLAILLIKKAKIEEKLRQTFRCILRKCFTCCGMKNIENELHHLNEKIEVILRLHSKKNKISYI